MLRALALRQTPEQEKASLNVLRALVLRQTPAQAMQSVTGQQKVLANAREMARVHASSPHERVQWSVHAR